MSEQIRVFTVSADGVLSAFGFERGTAEFSRLFNANDHNGKVRCLAASRKGAICTAGDDDAIKFYDSAKRCALQSVACSSTILKALFTRDYVICAHENGQVSIIGSKDFALYHSLNVSRNKLIDVDVHKSGRLLLCLSNTGRFALWSLLDCGAIFHRKALGRPFAARFVSESVLALVFPTSILLYNAFETAAVRSIELGEEQTAKELVVHEYGGATLLLVGCESGIVRIYCLSADLARESWAEFQAYDKRVKSLRASNGWLFTISTEGKLSAWNCEKLFKALIAGEDFAEAMDARCELAIGARLTLLEILETAKTPIKESKHCVKKIKK